MGDALNSDPAVHHILLWKNKTKQNKVLFAFVLLPYLKISFPVPQIREGLLFPFIEEAGLGARDPSTYFADERIEKNAETLGDFTVD